MQVHEWFALAVASIISGLYWVEAVRAAVRRREELHEWFVYTLRNGR